VHILDYKPDARTNRPIAQLASYALPLTRRVQVSSSPSTASSSRAPCSGLEGARLDAAGSKQLKLLKR
jgi:hypothetical protein